MNASPWVNIQKEWVQVYLQDLSIETPFWRIGAKLFKIFIHFKCCQRSVLAIQEFAV